MLRSTNRRSTVKDSTSKIRQRCSVFRTSNDSGKVVHLRFEESAFTELKLSITL